MNTSRKNKKTIALLLATGLTISLTGCNLFPFSLNKNTNSTSSTQQASTEVTTTGGGSVNDSNNLNLNGSNSTTSTEASNMDSTINLVQISTDDFSIYLPEGWQYVSYTNQDFTFYAYDPNNPSLCMWFEYSALPLMHDAQACSFFTAPLFRDAPALSNPTFENAFMVYPQLLSHIKANGYHTSLPDLYNVTATGSTPYSSMLSSISTAEGMVGFTCNTADGTACEGTMAGSLVNQVTQYNLGIDTGYYALVDVMVIMGPKDSFKSYAPVLNQCLSTLTPTQSFVDNYIANSNEATSSALQSMEQNSAIFDAYVDAWTETILQ